MDSRLIKSVLTKIRTTLTKDAQTEMIDLKGAAEMCERNGFGGLNLKFWRNKVSNRDWPGVLMAGKWHVRRDYIEELFRQLRAEAA